MSKLSFRARALDASKPMPIYMAEELPDLPDYSAINRAVPQMPSGMEKEEECEHHLQRAICAGLIIPTPEVSDIPDPHLHDKLYPASYKQPRQMIHMQPFTMEQDIPDYDMDSDDERWLDSQAKRIELSPLKFEEMMDRLEKSSGQTVVTLNEAKALLKEDDDLIIAVFDYWLNKRLNLQHPLILSVKTEHRIGTAVNNPYLAFRRRTEKMQTRKNRKNDETSYEKMLKLRRDLSRAVTLLELVKRREKIKREYVHLTIEVFEKRYQAKDFSGAIMAEVALKTSRPAFTPIFQNHYTNQSWTNKAILKDEIIPRKEKRQYKKRKHKSLGHNRVSGMVTGGLEGVAALSSDEEPIPQPSPEPEETDDEGQFAFRRNKLCSYHMPKSLGNWPWCSKEENGLGDKRFRYTLTSLSNPKRCIGFARRRMGRGGRVILDRLSSEFDDFWETVDYTIYDSLTKTTTTSSNSISSFASTVTAYEQSTTTVKEEPDSEMTNSSLYMTATTSSNNSLKFHSNKSVGYSDNLRTSSVTVGDSSISESEIKCKQEPVDIQEELLNSTEGVKNHPQNTDEMVEILRSVQRDWLHFRPKTPPPDYEPPCYMLPPEDPTFIPSANTPFSLELRLAEDSNNVLLDNSTFVTSPFLYEDFTLDMSDVPVTDTRQSSDTANVQTGINLNVNVGLNTLNTTNTNNDNSFIQSVNLNDNLSLSVDLSNNDDGTTATTGGEDVNNRTIGCSRFTVTDINGSAGTSSNRYKQLSHSSTLTSPKLNSVNVVSDFRQRSTFDCTTTGNANGLITQFMDVSPGLRTKNNKLQPYAYSGEVGNSSTNTLSLHTSAHTVTLNSHSANIVEIPMSNDSDAVSNKSMTAQCGETNTTPANNKNKTIVRKNNLVMEVT